MRRPASSLLTTLAIAAVLLTSYALALGSMVEKSPTFDEQGFIVRGLAYVRPEETGRNRGIRVGHPPGLNAYNALLLANDPTVRLPVDDPSWQESSFHRPAELFLWEIGNDVAHIMFLARLPSIWLGLLLVAVGSRWAADLMRKRVDGRGGRRRRAGVAALFAALLLGLDPNLLAHMRLATTDLGLAAAAALAGYLLWRWLRTPTWTNALLAGVGLGLLQNTKYTAALFVPLFALVFAVALLVYWRAARLSDENGDRHRVRALLVQSVAAYVPLSIFVLWASSGFDTGTLPQTLPLFPQLGGLTVPLPNFIEQLLDIGGRLQVSTPSFLLGAYSDSGWWAYFPVAFLVKTPLPVLILLAAALIRVVIVSWRQRFRLPGATVIDATALLVPPLGFFAIALTSDINLGYRHLLPILPFLYVGISAVLTPLIAPDKAQARRAESQRRGARAMVAVLLVWLVVVTIGIYPNYLTFFNVFAGGPQGGWRVLVDSNIDWGQDLSRLAEWQADNEIDDLWLSYFGEARPDYYGLAYTGLDSFPPRLMNPAARPFYPYDPAPGWYAISATNLQGVHFANKDQFAIFRSLPPEAVIGNSIFIHRVEPRGDAVNLLLDGVQIDEIDPADFAMLGTNDVRPHWIDGQQAVLLPSGSGPTWLAVAAGKDLDDQLLDAAGLVVGANRAASDRYTLHPLMAEQTFAVEPIASLASQDGRLSLVDYDVRQSADGVIELISAWLQDGEATPVTLFIHALNEQGELVGQWDGLGVQWEGWRPDAILLQRHRLELAEAAGSQIRLVAGAYDPQSIVRWRTAGDADFIELDFPFSARQQEQ